MNLHAKKSAFTLIELLLSIALISAIAGFSLPIYASFQAKNDLDIAANEVAETWRRAEVLAKAVDGDTSWGAKVQSGSIILFKGTSYAVRDVNFDEVFTVPTSITPGGLTEVVFSKFSGLPQSTGTLTLTLSNGTTRNLVINSKGMVEY